MRDLSVLSDVEFEELTADLLAAEYGVHVERFPRGRDGGVDLRWKRVRDAEYSIGQCKHYSRSTFAQLKAAAREEVAHLETMTVADYRFVTSMDLTRAQKDEICDILPRWLKGPHEVLSAGDLDAMLTCHPHVERGHPKLWVSFGSIVRTPRPFIWRSPRFGLLTLRGRCPLHEGVVCSVNCACGFRRKPTEDANAEMFVRKWPGRPFTWRDGSHLKE